MEPETRLANRAAAEHELRLAALDRAINRLQAKPDATPEDVVNLAAKFEQYIKG